MDELFWWTGAATWGVAGALGAVIIADRAATYVAGKVYGWKILWAAAKHIGEERRREEEGR